MLFRFLLPALLLVSGSLAGPAPDAPRDPKFATITAACNPSGTPSVQPVQVFMTRADNVEWREPSGRAASWTITPKDPARWPFSSAAIGGEGENAANSGTPVAGAPAGTYGYNVIIRCQDGSEQTIDPDIIIGESE